MAAASAPRWIASRPAMLLLGDSLTQEGNTLAGGWAALLSAHYSRRADMVNRGLSGYNSRWALQGLDCLWPPHQTTVLTTVWYGANDAADAQVNPRQHVPVDEYKSNLREIIARAKSRCEAVIVLSPPPIHEEMYRTEFVEPKAGKGAPPDRCLAASGRYAAAAGEVAAAAGCPFIDLWGKMQAADPPASAGAAQPWGRFFYDGLHLSADGNRFVFDEVLATVAARFPDLVVQPDVNTGKKDNSGSASDRLAPHLPWHDHITLENQAAVLLPSAAADRAQGGGAAKRPREE